MTRFLQSFHRDTRGTSHVEYVLILALVVLPLAAIAPLIMRIIRTYTQFVVETLVTPFN